MGANDHRSNMPGTCAIGAGAGADPVTAAAASGPEAVETGGELLRYIVRGPGRNLHLEQGRSCLLCGVDCSRVGIGKLAYVFEVCECGRPDYPHLVERLQHRSGC